MSALIGHAKAARIMGQSIIDLAMATPEVGADCQALLIVLGRAHMNAADEMEQAMRDEANPPPATVPNALGDDI